MQLENKDLRAIHMSTVGSTFRLFFFEIRSTFSCKVTMQLVKIDNCRDVPNMEVEHLRAPPLAEQWAWACIVPPVHAWATEISDLTATG